MKKRNRLVIVGAGQTGEQILRMAYDYCHYDELVFAVDPQYLKATTVFGHGVQNLIEIDSSQGEFNDDYFVAISWNRLNLDRTIMYNRLSDMGVSFANIISENAVFQRDYRLGSGIWISDHVLIENAVTVQDNSFIKSGALVLHNTLINKHCFIGANSVIGGNSVIGEGTFVGMGAIIHNDLQIGKHCIIGAGAIVNKNVPDFTVVYPSKSIYKAYNENEIRKILTVGG